MSCALCRASQRRLSAYSPKGSTFWRHVPLKMVASAGARLTMLRRAARPSVELSKPFRRMRPLLSSSSRRTHSSVVDLPHPLRPVRPTLARAGTSRLTPRSTLGLPGCPKTMSCSCRCTPSAWPRGHSSSHRLAGGLQSSSAIWLAPPDTPLTATMLKSSSKACSVPARPGARSCSRQCGSSSSVRPSCEARSTGGPPLRKTARDVRSGPPAAPAPLGQK
mmetsp:Transcript_87068/g.224218  ORF Transcript_87068/g.224218 Transcript_87068/m.224218 type:complete len:220 (+) Transcript_87068:410-1069(+)